MSARVSVTSNGSLPSRRIVSLIRGADGAAHLLDRFGKRHARCTGSPSIARMRSPGFMPGLGGRRVVDRRDHLDEAVLHRHFDAEPAELAAGLDLHVLEVLRVHVARMRIERRQHAVDGRFDQRLRRRRARHSRAHALEHFTKQVESAGRVRSCRLRACIAPSSWRQRGKSATGAASKASDRRSGYDLHAPSCGALAGLAG